jgi:hypothetical protein
MVNRKMDEEMKEGYLALAIENKEFAELILDIAMEVIAEWE